VKATVPQILEIEGDTRGGELSYKVHALRQPLAGVEAAAGLDGVN
jgi:hypothetical protein